MDGFYFIVALLVLGLLLDVLGSFPALCLAARACDLRLGSVTGGSGLLFVPRVCDLLVPFTARIVFVPLTANPRCVLAGRRAGRQAGRQAGW